ncbi:MAG: DUF4838 domain-containing protein [Clostridia bacterium]|nr:DUF4838 domain-containing protein [Clostridia bacterium]
MFLHRNGRSTYYVIYGSAENSVLQNAVSEFCYFVRLCFGQDLQASNIIPVEKYESYVLIGADDEVLNAFGVTLPREKFGEDTVYIGVKGNAVVIDGGKRGLLYAVYEFLHKYFGCRFYLPEQIKTPVTKDVELQEGEYLYTPAISFREVYSYDSRSSREFRARTFQTNEVDPLSMSNCGVEKLWSTPGCHTVDQLLLPVDDPEYGYDKHPEYFSYLERKGKRYASFEYRKNMKWLEGEICWTNSEVIEIITERLKRWILDSPRSRAFSITQNDFGEHCECPECKRLAYEHGKDGEPRWSAPIVYALNKIGKNIKEWQKTDERVKNREIFVESFAYIYGKEAPIGMELEDNVMIRLCTSYCLAHASDDENCAFNREVRRICGEWSKVCKKLYLWTYPNNHNWYGSYTPLLKHAQSHIKYFAGLNVYGLFNEFSDFGKRVGPLYAVKQYMLARLTWNPDIDCEAEWKEAVEYLYEDAAPYILEVEKRYFENCENIPNFHHLGSQSIMKDYYTDEFLDIATQLYEQALKHAKKARIRLLVRKEYFYLKWTKMFLHRGTNYAEMDELLEEMDELELHEGLPKADLFKQHYYGGEKSDWFLESILIRNKKAEDAKGALLMERNLQPNAFK